MSLPQAVLDTDVIYSRVLHEFCGRAAVDGLIMTLIWSDELIAEVHHALTDYKEIPRPAADRWAGHLTREFPGGRVDLETLSPSVDLFKLTKDPGDEHVCALAVAGGADYLLTFDRGYRRRRLKELGVTVMSPDRYLTDRLAPQPRLLKQILETQAAAWGGGRPVGELIDALERAKAERLATAARPLFS